jgi:hypothetical protein
LQPRGPRESTMALVDEEDAASSPSPHEGTGTALNQKGDIQVAKPSSPGPHSTSPVPDDVGLAEHLFLVCVEFCRISSCCIKRTSIVSSEHQRGLSRVAHSLSLWGQDYDILSGVLDFTLQRSRRLQRITIKVLRSILRRLAHGM